MAWKKLKVSLNFDSTSMDCDGGRVVAQVRVQGETDGGQDDNEYTVFLKDDYLPPDVLWNSGPRTEPPSQHVDRKFEVELWCNDRCHVSGPAGSSKERVAEVYAHALSVGRESQTGEFKIACRK
ncbi:MAG: hypothetical protein HKO64_02605 [Xanthomonadales bacterium]|nr:hypothetical protein [Gammaproteobacteria bacterium]NNE06798.1 hypothetical protein [Xanthomonadales bacterium]NNL94489.1 hypothetical protein [Xanthomonadales bacterium]